MFQLCNLYIKLSIYDDDDDELFCGMVERRRRLALFSAGIIVRGAHNRESLTRHETCV